MPKLAAGSHVNRVLRRDLLRCGVLSLSAVSYQQLLAQSADSGKVNAEQTHPRTAARNCILIWLDGGPSHLETWDVKPDAPVEVRGPLQAISTASPGIAVSECLPETARRMRHLAIIRSMTSPLGEHNLGTHYLLTGYQPTPVLEYPAFHAVGSFFRQQVPGHGNRQRRDENDEAGGLPRSIAIPNYRVGGARFSGAGYLSPTLAPFAVNGDPASDSFQVRDVNLSDPMTSERLARRQHFMRTVRQFDGKPGHGNSTAESAVSGSAGIDAFDQAFDMLTSNAAREAFDLTAESPETRRRYGPRTVGQSCLLARRLVERGVPFVTVNYRGWDTHANLFTQLKEGFTGAKVPVGLIPSLDLALSALLDDLFDRGLLDETLVVVMGEFGRTPKLNANGGRDHWPRAFSVALAGGGVQGGQVIGASDRTGESPADRPITPSDLVATIYRLLGIDPQTELHTADGRPVRLVPHTAKVISELL